MAAEVSDLNIIQDEDILRRMWNQAEDFSRKKEIRTRMYKLREERLKSYYITKDTTNTTDNDLIMDYHKPKSITSHSNSVNNERSTRKEICDAATPIFDHKQSSSSQHKVYSSTGEQKATQSHQSTHSQQTITSRFSTNISNKCELSSDQGFAGTRTMAICDSVSPSLDHRKTSSSQYNINSSSGDQNLTQSRFSKHFTTRTSSNNSNVCDSTKDHDFTKVQTKEIYDSPSLAIKQTDSSQQSIYSSSGDQKITQSSQSNHSQQVFNSHNSINSSNLLNNNKENQIKTISSTYETSVPSTQVSRDTDRKTSSHQYQTTLSSSARQVVSSNQATNNDCSFTTNKIREEANSNNTDYQHRIEVIPSTNNTTTDYRVSTKTESKTHVDDNQNNVNHSIMNELHKLDTYLLNEANKSLSTDTNESRVSRSKTIEERTNNQQSYSKISSDTSATHNAFASSLRASPERASPSSPGKRSPSKCSLDRSSPEKSRRSSPEKCPSYTSNDLSRKYTASFQNRVTSTRRSSKSPSPTKKRSMVSSASEYDSDESSATYNKKCEKSTFKYVYNKKREHKESTGSSPERPVSKHSEKSTSDKIDVSTENIKNLPVVCAYPGSTGQSKSSYERISTSKISGDSKSASSFEKTIPTKPAKTPTRSPEKSPPRMTKDKTGPSGSTVATTSCKAEETSTSETRRERINKNLPNVCAYPESTYNKRQTLEVDSKSKPGKYTTTKKTLSRESESCTSRSEGNIRNELTKTTYRSPDKSPSRPEKDTINSSRIACVTTLDKTSQKSPQSPERSPQRGMQKICSQTTAPPAKSPESFPPVSTEKVSRTPKTYSPPKSPERSPQRHTKDVVGRPKSIEKCSFVREPFANPEKDTRTITSSPHKKSSLNQDLVEVTEGDDFEEIHVTPKKATSDTITSTPTKKNHTPKKRSLSCKELSRVKKNVENKQDDSTSESSDTTSGSSESESEEEPEETIIEEIIDEDSVVPSISRQISQNKDYRPVTKKVIPEEKMTAAQLDDVKTESPVEQHLPSSVLKSSDEIKRLKSDTPIKTEPKKTQADQPESKTIGKPVEPEPLSSKPVDTKNRKTEEIRSTKPTVSTPTKPKKLQGYNQTRLTEIESKEPNISELEQQISTDEELKKASDTVDRSIPKGDDETKTNTAVFTKKKVFQAGEFGGSVPSIEKILGSSVIRAINDDFIKRERKYVNGLFSAQNGKTTPKKPVVSEVKLTQTTSKDSFRAPTKKTTTKETLSRRSNSENITKKVPQTSTPKKSRTEMIKTTTQKNLINRISSDRSLKEKNEKLADRKLNAASKTKSETTLQRSRLTSPTYQQRTSDRIIPIAQKSNKENEVTVKTTSKTTQKTTSQRSLNEKNLSKTPSSKKTPTIVPKKAPLTPKSSKDLIKVSPSISKPKTASKTPTIIKNTTTESISSASSSSVSLVDLRDELNEIETTRISHIELNGHTNLEPREPLLNVNVRLPTSLETSPSKCLEEVPFCTVTDDDTIPRHPDCVIEPDDQRIMKRNSNRLPFEKIIDLDAEESSQVVNVSVADRRTMFLENVKENSENSVKTTFEKDHVFQNREQDVSKKKEMFENIVKSQKPNRPPPILSRPSIFEHRRLGVTIEEEGETEGHDGDHKVVSKKLDKNDYDEYVKEKEQKLKERDHAAEQTKKEVFKENHERMIHEERGNVTIKQSQLTKTDITEDRYENKETNCKITKTQKLPSSSSVITSSETSFSVQETEKISPQKPKLSSSENSSSILRTTSVKQKSSSSCDESNNLKFKLRETSPTKSTPTSPTKNILSKPAESTSVQICEDKTSVTTIKSRETSPIKSTPLSPAKNISQISKDKATTSTPKSRETSPTKSRPTSPTKNTSQIFKDTASTLTPKSREPSPTKSISVSHTKNSQSSSLKPNPIEVTTVEIKPSKQVFTHTAITNVPPYESETGQKCTFTVSVDTKTSSSCNERLPSPSKKIADDKLSSKPSTKVQNKFQSVGEKTDTKRKPFEKRLSTTGCDYENRKNFFETKSQQSDLLTKSTKASEARVATTTTHLREERKSPQREPKVERRRSSQEKRERVDLQTASCKSPEKTTPKKGPFGVVLKKTSSKSESISSSTERTFTAVEVSEEEKKIEEIFDLEVLKIMLESAVKYDIRSRIRAQIRLIKQQQQSKKTSRTPSPEKASLRDTNKMTNGNQVNTSNARSVESRRSMLSITSTPDNRDKVKKRLFSEADDSIDKKSTAKSTRTMKQGKTEHTLSSTKLSAIEKDNCSESPRMDAKPADKITSPYGLGPTDEDGELLFGLKALRTASDAKDATTTSTTTSSTSSSFTRQRNEFTREVTDHMGRPLFGLKALQRAAHYDDFDEVDGGSLHSSIITSGDKQNDYGTRKSSSQSSSTMYTSRTAMKSDSSGNVTVLKDELKGEMHSKDGNEPIGKMVATRYSYQKPENGEPTIKKQTATRVLNADSQTTEETNRRAFTGSKTSTTKTISDNDSDWRKKLTSTSLIRRISNEHFEKAHRKFSGNDEASPVKAPNLQRNSFETRTESSSSISSRRTHSTSESLADETRTTDLYRTSAPSSYSPKDHCQQATVSSIVKQADRLSLNENESPTFIKKEAEYFSSETNSRNEKTSSVENGCTMRSSYSSQSFSEHDTGSRPDYTDDEKESISVSNKYGSGSVSLRDLTHYSRNSSETSTISNQKKHSQESINYEEISDEEELRNLLQSCTDYKNRPLIRARLRTVMAENKANTDVLTTTDGDDVTRKNNETSETMSSVTTDQKNGLISSCTKEVHSSRTSVTGRFHKANSVASPLSKFHQLERQSSLPSSGPHPTPIHNNYTNPHLSRSASSIKDRMLNWVKAQTKEYKNVQIDNFSTSWNNGLAFCALIHHFCPHAFDYNQLTPDNRRYNFELAFRVAEEEAGIMALLDVEDMVIMKRPDWKCVFTYVQTFYQRFHATSKAIRTE